MDTASGQTEANRFGVLTLADVLAVAQIPPAEVVVIRHSFTPDGIQSPVDATPEKVLAYTYEQGTQPGHKLGPQPPATWLVFLADGARRSRLFRAYDNRGGSSPA